MKRKIYAFVAVILALACIISGPLSMPAVKAIPAPGVVYQSLGTNAPPASLGGYPLVKIADGYSNGRAISSIPTAMGNITTSSSIETRTLGLTWSTWSHGNTGRVYYSSARHLVLTMPSNVRAFTIYLEPNPFGVYNFTVKANDGIAYTAAADGNGGAVGFGFYSTGSENISTITIDGGIDFALGEIYVNQIPSAISLSATADSITVVPVPGCEYSLDNLSWQDGNIFTREIQPNTFYTVFMRAKGASTSISGSITTPKRQQAAPKAPVAWKVLTDSVFLFAIPGVEYSKDGITWQSDSTFRSLTPGTEYTFYARAVETDTAYASEKSAGCTVKTIPVYNLTYNLDGGIANNPATYRGDNGKFTLKTPTKKGYTFLGWSGTDINGTEMTVTIPAYAKGDKTYTANWSINYYDINATVNNTSYGTVTGAKSYKYGACAVLTATPNPGYRFVRWDPDGLSTSAVYKRIVTESQTYVAVFAPIGNK